MGSARSQENKSGRERVLDAAVSLFSRQGFHQVTTDQIAKKAEVSQAYAVRAFGGKFGLILAVCRQASDNVERMFHGASLANEGAREEFRTQFYSYAFESDEMRLLAQLFVCGEDPQLGPLAREGFIRISRLIHDELEISLLETRQIMAQGMLAATLTALNYARPAPELVEYLITGRE